MLIELRLRLTSKMLGDTRAGKDGIYRFDRSNDRQQILLPAGRWAWALREARAALHLTEKMQLPDVPDSIRSPSMHYCRRSWMRDGHPMVSQFEAIAENCVLTIKFLRVENPTDDGSSPELQHIEKMMEFVGQHIGISPWGSKMGYGRFRVESIGDALDDSEIEIIRDGKLPAQFMAQFSGMTRETHFLGAPIHSLSRPELLAIVAYYESMRNDFASEKR